MLPQHLKLAGIRFPPLTMALLQLSDQGLLETYLDRTAPDCLDLALMCKFDVGQGGRQRLQYGQGRSAGYMRKELGPEGGKGCPGLATTCLLLCCSML